MKNKARNHAKQAQKRALKNSRRKASYQPKPRVKPTLDLEAVFPEDLQLFWRAHGINFILSDHETATWTPLFDSIYEPGASMPSLNDITQRVMSKFGTDSGNWPPEGRAALGWAVSSKETLFVYYQEALRRLPAVEGADLIRQPHNPLVWGVFQYLRTELASRTA